LSCSRWRALGKNPQSKLRFFGDQPYCRHQQSKNQGRKSVTPDWSIKIEDKTDFFPNRRPPSSQRHGPEAIVQRSRYLQRLSTIDADQKLPLESFTVRRS